MAEEELLPLVGHQPMFCLMYVSEANFNGTDAAEMAGYAGNRAQLASIASENLRKPHIRAEIERLMAARAIGPNEILARLGDMARGPGEYIMPDGSVDMRRLVKDGKGHLVKEVRETVSRSGGKETVINRSYKFHDSRQSLVDLGRHFSLWTDGLDLTTKGEKLAAASDASTMAALVALYDSCAAGGAPQAPGAAGGGGVAADTVRATDDGVPEPSG